MGRERFYRFERRHGQFARSVTLPAGVKDGDVKAEYKDGVLEIRVPKPEEQKPTRIQIGSKGAIEGNSTQQVAVGRALTMKRPGPHVSRPRRVPGPPRS